jgi:N-methylhydantoinase A
VTPAFTIGIDTGGTFTDAFIADDDGRHWTVKVPTTPHDLTVCFADAIGRSAEATGLGREELLRQAAVIRFSSTIGTNTILTRSGPKVGLIVTRGEESSLYGAADGGALWRFIPPEMVAGIDEGVDTAGRVTRAPSSEEVNLRARDLLERGARILVVSLRNATRNPGNESFVLRTIYESYPRHYLGAVPTLLSTHVSAVADDAGRTSAAVLNAYMHRKLATSLYKAEDDLRRNGFRHPLLVVTTDGSVNRVAKTRALSTYQSGPAAGVHGSSLLAATYDVDAALTADVGGTSSDLGLIARRHPIDRPRLVIGEIEVPQRSVELFSIALGGGSVCSVASGELTVGPESAAAAPGPASFGLGGRDATPTDAWLVLGYLDPDYYLGGRRRLMPDLARRALDERIGQPLGLATDEAALAVKDATERTLARGIEEMLSRPAGRDSFGGRALGEIALVAYGGGGGILLPSVAQALGMQRVFLSGLSPVFSAFGVSTFHIEHRYEARVALNGETAKERSLKPLLEAARRDVRGEGFDPDTATLSVDIIDESGDTLIQGISPDEVAAALGRLASSDGSVILSLSATCQVSTPGLPEEPAGAGSDPSEAQSGTRPILLASGSASVPVYARDRLRAGHRLEGPCLVESAGSTYLIPDGMACEIDRFTTAIVS